METPRVVDWRLLAKTTPGVTGKGALERGRDTWTLESITRCYSNIMTAPPHPTVSRLHARPANTAVYRRNHKGYPYFYTDYTGCSFEIITHLLQELYHVLK